MPIKCRIRNWGSSLGVVIPKRMADEKNLKQGDEVIIDVQTANGLRSVFGILEGAKIDTQKFKDEMRESDRRSDEKLLRQALKTGSLFVTGDSAFRGFPNVELTK